MIDKIISKLDKSNTNNIKSRQKGLLFILSLNKTTLIRFAVIFAILLPITASVLCIGYFRPRYDADFTFSDIRGEGQVKSYLSSFSDISQYYEATGAFYPELEELKFIGYHYDVEAITLSWTGVKSLTIDGVMLSMFGIPLGSYTAAELFSEGELSEGIKVESDGSSVSFAFKDTGKENYATAKGIRIIPIWFWGLYFLFVLLINLAVSAGIFFLMQRYGKESIPLGVMAASLTLFSLLLGMYINGSFPYITYDYLFFNWLIIFSASLLIGSLSFFWLGPVFVSLVIYIWSTINYFVIKYRVKPIMPSDLSAVDTARQVLDGYNLMPTASMIVCGVVLLICEAAFIKYTPNKKADSITQRGVRTLVCLLVLIFCVKNPVFASLDKFAWDVMLLENFNREGMVLTFAKSALSAGMTRPEGYSKEALDGYLKLYLNEDEKGYKDTDIQPKRIIMIMNEAFADLKDSGMKSSFNSMPYINSLTKNTMSGSLYVSVYGGGTCNTEFEALTGNSLAFFPSASYPYTQSITEEMFSLADFFGDNGYYTAAFHPQMATNWNRNRVYPLLGFKDFFSIDRYEGVKKIRGKASDASNYRFIEKTDEGYEGKLRFLFNVTLQNHSDYDTWDNLKKAKGTEELPTRELQVYQSLVKESDEAVKQLITEYEASDEPTMVVFFGDHQPGLSSESQNFVYGAGRDELCMYKSDFFIWTNYDTKESEGVELSANFLPYIIAERANFSLPPYLELLKKVHSSYPIITAAGLVDRNGNYFYSVQELMDTDIIKEYHMAEYANMHHELGEEWFLP